jgi:membrane associated rhomboid family serine protease
VADPANDDQILTRLLQSMAEADPAPWYPAEYAARAAVARDALDEPLARLRVNGLARLTDWIAGKGQGYQITLEGRRALREPRRLREPPPSRPEPRPSAPSGDAPITRLLIAAQVGVFVLGLAQSQQIGIDLNEFLASGQSPIRNELAVSGRFIRGGAWWTLLSYALVHGGMIHLACNLIGHLSLGPSCERLFGRSRFVASYLLAVFCGGVAAVLANPLVATVGSSGGLCGLLAAQAVWAVRNRQLFPEYEWDRVKSGFLRSGLLIVLISFAPGVSWAGHLGGAAGGAFALGVLPDGRTSWARQVIGWIAGIAIVPLGASLLYWKLW